MEGKTRDPHFTDVGETKSNYNQWYTERVHLWHQYNHHQYTLFVIPLYNVIVLYLAIQRKTTSIQVCVGTNQDEISIEEDYGEISDEMREIYLSLSYVVSIRIVQFSQTQRNEHVISFFRNVTCRLL